MERAPTLNVELGTLNPTGELAAVVGVRFSEHPRSVFGQSRMPSPIGSSQISIYMTLLGSSRTRQTFTKMWR